MAFIVYAESVKNGEASKWANANDVHKKGIVHAGKGALLTEYCEQQPRAYEAGTYTGYSKDATTI